MSSIINQVSYTTNFCYIDPKTRNRYQARTSTMEKRSRDEKMGGPGPQTRGPPGRQLPPPPPPPHSRGPPPPPPRPRSEPIDREKIGAHHSEVDFAVRGNEPKDEVQIYTWKDATLRELTDLVKEIAPEARRRNARLSFAFVYPDKRGRFVVKQVGMTNSHGNGRQVDESKALNDLSFQIGDYLDVAIL